MFTNVSKDGNGSPRARAGRELSVPIAALFAAATIYAGAAFSAVAPPSETQRARADLRNTEGKIVGTVMLEQIATGVQVTVHIVKLPPGAHSFHIHDKSPCDAPDFGSAGGHFNPAQAQHGFLNPKGPHAGDLPNVVVAADGTAHAVFVTARFTLRTGEASSLLDEDGASAMIHEAPDDYLSDPAGGGGKRIACGSIERVK